MIMASYTTLLRFTVVVLMITLFVNALPLAVHSQSETEETETDAAITEEEVATTTEEVAAPVVETPWFEVEQLSGNVQVGDFVIGPGKVEVEVAPGQTVTEYISVSNRISDGRKFELAVEDIVGSGGSDAVILLGNDIGPYSVKNFISFPEDSFVIGLGQRARIPVTITIPENVSPGGYYGSVLVSTVKVTAAEALENTPDGGAATPIIARVGTLVFITVPGETETDGELKEVITTSDSWWYESGPVNFGLVYQNKGNRHLNPYGELRITNMLGEEVGFVELDPWFVLPKAIRTREVEWTREFLLGRYTATAQINRGYDDIIDTQSVTFWVLPWKIVVGVFLTVFIIFFAVRTFFRTFEFKRK